jgi:nucleoside-diphosphate-sugar epimerase
MHMGPGLYPAYQSVYREDQPRAPGPNWYYDLEDYIDGHAPSWTWSIFRPSFIVGFARNAPYNLGTTLALYATLRKARGEPLIFFGDRRSSETLWDISSARQLAQMMTWSTRSSASRNQAFNCTTGEPFRWKDLWPRLAQWFGMEALFIEDRLPVRSFFEDNVSLWNTLVQTHALQPFSLASLSSDDFVDRATTMDWDAVYSMEKAKSAGFPLDIHPEQVFIDLFEALVSDRVIPSPEALIKAEIR